MSLVDVVVGTALFLIIFLGLMSLLRASVLVSALSKQRAVATSIAEGQMEYVRSLSYDSVGNIGGIPAGVVPQYATTTLNGTSYSVRTFIVYVDDPADGIGASDTNGITTDYKKIKVSVTYTAGGRARSVDMLTNYAPLGIETTTGGGTLKVSVVGATGVPVPGATVQVVNSSLSPAVNLTTFSDSTGTVFLPGAATSTGYQVSVSKSGYSSAQTYARDSNNQNPTPGYLTVVKNQTTTGTFAIDLLANLSISTFTPVATSTFTDAFADSSKVAAMTNAAVSGGTLALTNGAGGYALSGSAVSVQTAPTYLYAWKTATSTISAPAGTSVLVHVVDGNGNALPDAVLPGNSAGFAGSIDLSAVSTSTYPSLALSANLSTNSTTTTPLLDAWTLTYQRGPVPLPNVPFTLTGAKTIGSTGGGAPIYKTTVNTSTDATGVKALALEWDSYLLSLSGYDVVDACNAPPYALSPGTSRSGSLYMASSTGNSLLVTGRDVAGTAVPGATATLSRTGYTQTVLTSSCGGAYFGNLASANDYTLVVSKPGYTTDTTPNLSITGHAFFADSL